MEKLTLGVLHPGAMGAAVGAAAAAGGAEVLWASSGRGAQTGARARAASLTDVGALAQLVARSKVIVSVCPPHAALEVAGQVAGFGFNGVYVDANAIAPHTARAVKTCVEAAGAGFVDGGIVGPPPHREGTTRLYLAGAQASEVAGVFAGTPLAAPVIEGAEPGAASALKMCYAAYTKGLSALLMAVQALAEAEGVRETLADEWDLSQPGLAERSERAACANAAKAWRFVGEMEQIAETFQKAALPDGFHRGAADLYRALAEFKDCGEPPDLAQVVAVLLGRRAPQRQ